MGTTGRFGFPRPGYTPCTWLTTLSREDLVDRCGVLPADKLVEIKDAVRLCEQPREWTPATAAKFSAIRNALRPGGPV
jgi:mRNA interferase MazF